MPIDTATPTKNLRRQATRSSKTWLTISALWASMLFVFAYVDLFSSYRPDSAPTSTGRMMVSPSTDVPAGNDRLCDPPCPLIVGTLILPPRVNRVANIALSRRLGDDRQRAIGSRTTSSSAVSSRSSFYDDHLLLRLDLAGALIQARLLRCGVGARATSDGDQDAIAAVATTIGRDADGRDLVGRDAPAIAPIAHRTSGAPGRSPRPVAAARSRSRWPVGKMARDYSSPRTRSVIRGP